MSHHNLILNPVRMHEAMKTLDAKVAVDKELDEMKYTPAWQESS